MRLNVKIPNTSAVVAAQTASWVLPVGRRYHELQLTYSGVTLAQMTEIRVIANGEVIHRYSATELDSMNQFDGRAAAAGILTIAFDRFNLYSQVGEEGTAIQTASTDPKTGASIINFTLEVDVAAGAAAPAITVNSTVSDNVPGKPGPGLIMRKLKFAVDIPQSGINELSKLPKGTEGSKYAFLNRAFFKSANLLDLTIVRDNYTIFERAAALNTRVQTDGVRTPQAGYFVFDPTEQGYDFEPVSMFTPGPNSRPFQDFRYKLNMSAAEAGVVALVEYIGALN